MSTALTNRRILSIAALGWLIAVGCAERRSSPTDPLDSAADRQAAQTDAAASAPAGASDASGAAGSADTAESEPAATAEVDPDADRSDSESPITTPQQLVAAIRTKNPGFQDQNMGMQPVSAELLQVAINDPAVKDISPLRRQRIAILDLRGCDVTDLGPLEDMPIVELYLEENKRLSDLSPLRGMPLQKLYVSNTAVENLGPLRGAPLIELNAVGARIKDLAPLSGCPLQMLWLSGCPVVEIAPLQKTPLVSLTLENTPVADIGPLAGHPLQRLHIGRTQVSDLSPVARMQLSRLIFTPSRIEKGLEAARNSASISEIGVDLESRMSPAEFWQLYDQGKLE